MIMYKLTGPTDKYFKAKQDMITAMMSVSELSYEEQMMLAEELFGATLVALTVEVLKKYFG